MTLLTDKVLWAVLSVLVGVLLVILTDSALLAVGATAVVCLYGIHRVNEEAR